METPRSLQYNNNDDGSDAQGSSHINGYSNWNVSLINSPTPVRDTSLIPGTVPFEPGDQFDVTSELDIDRVELVADSEYGDEWSVGTPSLPALSLSSSEESIHPSSHSDFSIPVRSNFKVSHRSVLGSYLYECLFFISITISSLSYFCTMYRMNVAGRVYQGL